MFDINLRKNKVNPVKLFKWDTDWIVIGSFSKYINSKAVLVVNLKI